MGPRSRPTIVRHGPRVCLKSSWSDVGRRVTGRETRAMWEHYQAQAVGDDLHDVVDRVHAARARNRIRPVSYTPLTLPTNYPWLITGGAV